MALHGHIPFVHGPCGARAFPIYRGDVLEGIEMPSGRQYRYTSLLCLAPSNRLRVLVIFLVESVWFERASLLAIMLNCVALAAECSAGPVASADPQAQTNLELMFTLGFTAELGLRVAAMGLSGHEWSYLSDAWNRLDCLVVVTSWLPILFPSLSNLSSLRALRALRPLRMISRLPGMRRQVNTLLDSLPHLMDIATLSFFVLVLFGIVGLQLFRGSLRMRCYDAADVLAYAQGEATPLDPVGRSLVGVCHTHVEERLGSGVNQSGVNQHTQDARGSCDVGQQCLLYGSNPLYGTVGFDNIIQAWMTIFQCTTLEGWTDVLDMTRGSSALAGVYFVALVVFGSFYIPNLCLAVLWHIYQTNSDGGAKRGESVALSGSTQAAPDGGEGISLHIHTSEGGAGISLHIHTSEGGAGICVEDQAVHRLQSGARAYLAKERARQMEKETLQAWLVHALVRARKGAREVISSSAFGAFTTALILFNLVLLNSEERPMEPSRLQILERCNLVIILLFTLELLLKV